MPLYRYLLLLTSLVMGLGAWAAEQAPVTWVYAATWSRDPGVARVADAEGLDGKALEYPKTDKTWSNWYTFTSGYTMDYLPGEYEVRYRLKVEENTSRDVLFDLGVENGGVWEHPRGTDFTAPGKYQEFVYPFTIKLPVLNICTVRKHAGSRAWIDRIMVIRKRRYTETEQLAFSKFQRPAHPALVAHEGLNVWFVKGLYYQHYHLHELLEQQGAHITYAWYTRGQRGSALAGVPLEGLPPKKAVTAAPANPDEEKRADTEPPPPPPGPYDVALRFDLIVLCDVDAECLTVPQRAMIQDFVTAGGGLLVVGGPFAFGHGQLAQSELLSPLLPVDITGEYDLQPFPTAVPLQPVRGKIAKEGLTWAQQPAVRWMHRTTPKPGATVELTAGGTPALVTWQFGKGRVAVLTATVLGEMPAGTTAFWEWPDWSKLMTNTLHWLASR